MAELWKPHAIGTYLDWIKTIIEEAEGELNDWERSFIADITMRLEKGMNLTENQADKLESIYTEKT